MINNSMEDVASKFGDDWGRLAGDMPIFNNFGQSVRNRPGLRFKFEFACATKTQQQNTQIYTTCLVIVLAAAHRGSPQKE